MKKKKFLFAFVASMLLTGCATTPINPENLIPEGFVEDLTGTYVGKEGTLEVSDEFVKLNGTTLTPTKYVVEEFPVENAAAGDEEAATIEHAVTYLKNGKEEYRIYFDGENGKYLLALEKKENSGYEPFTTFMPTIEEFTGSYSYFGDGNAYNTLLYVGNYYNKYLDTFDLGVYGAFAGYMTDVQYIKSYKVLYKGETRTAISQYDFVDNYEFDTFLMQKVEDQYGLMSYTSAVNYDYESIDFCYDPLFLNLPYFASKDDSFTASAFDPSTKSLTIGNSVYTYEMEYQEEKGEVVTLTSGDKEVKVSPTPYGLLWSEGDKTTEYAYDSVAYIYGEYTHSDTKFELTTNDNGDDVVLINGKETDFSYTLYNHLKAVKTTIGEKDYYFAPFKQNVALLAGTSDSEEFFINEEHFASLYGKEFISKGFGTYQELIITPDFTVVYGGRIVDADLFYDPTLLYPYLEFEVNGTQYRFEMLEESIGAATLKHDGVEEFFFDSYVISPYYNDYTFHHEVDFALTPLQINYFKNNYDYAIEPYYYDFTFSYLISFKFVVDNEEIVAFASEGMMAMDIKNDEGKTETKTCITMEFFKELVGTYYLEANYGPEKFTLTEDGHFYADSMNSTNDGLVYDVEYNYSLFTRFNSSSNSFVPGIAFTPNGSQKLELIKIGNSLHLGTLEYAADFLFNYRGVYVSEDNTSVIEIRDDRLFVDGTEATIDEITYDESSTTITATTNFVQTKYYFMDFGDGDIYVSSDKNGYTSYTKSSFDFKTLVGEYVVGLTTYTVSVTTNPLTNFPSGYSLSDGFLTYTDYSFTMRNGTLAMKFELLAGTIYIYAGDDGNVLEVVSLTPPAPPGPPAPPAPPIF